MTAPADLPGDLTAHAHDVGAAPAGAPAPAAGSDADAGSGDVPSAAAAPAAAAPAGFPDIARAVAELEAADTTALDPLMRGDYVRLLQAVPGALHRDGDALDAEGRRVHLTASAFVMDAGADALGLIWHPKGEFWVQPGGHIDPGETSLESAARREVAEETGLGDLERVGPGPALLHRHALSGAFGACGEHWDVEYLLRAALPVAELVDVPSPEGLPIRWVPWPRGADGRHATEVELPEGAVPDLVEKIAALAPYVDRWVG